MGELARLKNIYGDGDLTQFPKFDFKEDIKIGLFNNVNHCAA